MTDPSNPIDQFASEVEDARRGVADLQTKVRLADLNDEIEDLESHIAALSQRLTALRSRGYAFEKGLEDRVSNLVVRWGSLKPTVQARVNQEIQNLSYSIRPLETELSRLMPLNRNPSAGQALLNQMKSEIDTLKSKTDAAQRAINGLYDTFGSEANQVIDHLNTLEWMCTQLEAACFDLLPTEACVMAVKATWYRDSKEDKDDPDGYLFLTDQRLLFEQNQEVATKKVLFITTEKKKVQQVLFEVPVTLIQDVKALKKGLFQNEDHLELHFQAGAPFSMAALHIFSQDCTTWAGLINSSRTGDIQKTRAIAIDAAAAALVKSAPTSCPSCNGALTQPVLRGMDSITCPYCGTVIRLT